MKFIRSPSDIRNEDSTGDLVIQSFHGEINGGDVFMLRCGAAYLKDSQGWNLGDFVCNPFKRCVHQCDVPTCVCDELRVCVREETSVDGTAASEDPRSVVRYSVFGSE